MEDDAGWWVLVVTLFAAGMVLVVIGREQRAGTLRRNWLAGLRTGETMRSDAAWRAAHAATAGLVTGAGLVQCVTAVALLFRPGAAAGVSLVLAATGVTLALVLVAGVRGHRIAARVNRERDAGLG